MSRYTSRVFEFGTALHTALDAATWPAHPVTAILPTVGFGETFEISGGETVALALNPERSLIEWKRVSPPGRDESVGFDVVVRSNVTLATSAEVWARLEALADVVQSTVFNTVSQTVNPLGVDGEVLYGLAGQVLPDVWPVANGHAGATVVSFTFLAQI